MTWQTRAVSVAHQSRVSAACAVAYSAGTTGDGLGITPPPTRHPDATTTPNIIADNPFPGQLFNKPTANAPGVDVYEGCKKSYTGQDVTAANLLNILKGNASAMNGIGSGEVLKSGPGDHVFINFVDHGAPGLVAMPVGDYLYANELLDALNFMYNASMYEKLVFYMEACESGSMFADLPNNTSIYATTAASASEPSWGWYCPPGDVVNGISVGSCLGDLYSVNWMEDSDQPGAMKESLAAQYKTVAYETNMSHVSEFGDLDFTSDAIGQYQGNYSSSSMGKATRLGRTRSAVAPRTSASRRDGQVGVDSRHAHLHSLHHLYQRATSEAQRADLAQQIKVELASQARFDSAFNHLARTWLNEAGGVEAALARELPAPFTYWACYREANNAVASSSCGRYTDYGLRYARVVALMCADTHGDTARVTTAVREACNK